MREAQERGEQLLMGGDRENPFLQRLRGLSLDEIEGIRSNRISNENLHEFRD